MVLFESLLLGSCAAVVGLAVFGALPRARGVKAKSDMVQLGEAFDLFRLKVRRYPSDLNSLTRPLANDPVYADGFIEELPKDPWGRSYLYRPVGAGFWLASLGRDGLPGGDGEDADIVLEEPGR